MKIRWVHLIQSIDIKMIITSERVEKSKESESAKEEKAGNEFGTHIDLLPLAHISHQPGEPEQPDEAEQLGEANHPEGAPGVQQLEAGDAVLLGN